MEQSNESMPAARRLELDVPMVIDRLVNVSSLAKLLQYG